MRRPSNTGIARCTAMCALIAMEVSCSTVQQPMPTASLPANLLVQPPLLPKMPRKADGTLDGDKALIGTLDLYSVAGAIRLQLLGLIGAERERQKASQAK